MIPEFDMPGHTSSWKKSHLELFAEGGELSRERRRPVLADFLGQYSEPLSWWMKNLKSLRSRNTFTYISIEYESD